MKLIYLPLLVVALTWRVDAQRHRLEAVNAQTPDGKILQQIGQESDPAKKIALMEQFTAEFPKSDASGWVLSQMQAAYIKENAFDKAYQEVVGYPALGANVRAGMRFRIGGE